MAKKKGNPDGMNILDFAVDAGKGLFSPLNVIIGDAFDPLGLRKTFVPTKSTYQDSLDKIVMKYAHILPPLHPKEPYDAYAAKLDQAKDEVDDMIEFIRQAHVLACIPFVNASGSWLFQVNRPDNRALLDQATDTLLAHHTYGTKPLIQRHIFKEMTPLLPEAYRLALAAAKDILTPAQYIDAMAGNGFDEWWSAVWQEENYEYPDFSIAAEFLWRGLLSQEDFMYFMRRRGFYQSNAQRLLELTKLIPPSADLITMVVREAFLPEMVVPAPDVFAGNMAKKGFSKEWSDRYWTAHFLPIPLGQAYDNLRRGYWTKDQFMFALHIADIHPRWREDIYNVAFNPPSLREMGYGYDVGAYTEEDIIKYRRWGGLSEEDAKKAALAMVAYRTEAEREAVRREHLRLFALGKEDESSFLSNLQRLGTAPPAIPLWIERGKLEAERRATEPALPEQRMVSSTEALYAFENGLEDESWTRKALADLLWTGERINLAISRVKWEIEQERIKAEVVEERALSVAIIRDYLKYGYITEEQVPVFLTDLGYKTEDAVSMGTIIAEEVAEALRPRLLSEADAEALYDMRLLGVSDHDALVKMRAIIGPEGIDSPTLALFNYYRSLKYGEGDSARLTLETGVKFAFPDLRSMYSKGWITADVLVSELMRVGLPKIRAGELTMTVVKAEAPARTVTEKDLTKAEIIKGWKVGIVTTNEAIGLLVGLGYDQFEAEYVLAINKVVAAGDPQGYWEMRAVVEASKKARGLASVEIPPEVIVLEKSLRETKSQLQDLQEEKATEEQIGEVAVRLAGLESELRRLIQEKKL